MMDRDASYKLVHLISSLLPPFDPFGHEEGATSSPGEFDPDSRVN